MSEILSSRVYVDETHCGRHVTGLERITIELFSAAALTPLAVEPVRAAGRKTMMGKQTLALPLLALRNRSALFLCPGFPPSPLLTMTAGRRVVPYIHDLFLLTRPQDLNRRAKLYMVAPFRMIVRRGLLFLVNSKATADELRRFCRPEAEIVLYRPGVRNVFGVAADGRAGRGDVSGQLRLIAIGTVEPRKNLFAAAAILRELRAGTHPAATLDIVGRPGWGVDLEGLAATPGVTVHGYQSTEGLRALIERADALLCTSHDEGLGLPLLEAQYAGLPVVAPARPVFAEVLGQSGLIVDTDDPVRAARDIGQELSREGWRGLHAASALANIAAWNRAAAADRAGVVGRLQRLESEMRETGFRK